MLQVILTRIEVWLWLQGYIRDCQFDPSRWVAPGMLVSKEIVCRCKVEKQMFKPFKSTTSKVIGVFGNEILTDTLRTETIKPKIGLTCDKGHRYLCSKTVADVMEALIGAYLVGRNVDSDPEEGALEFMKWAGIDVDYNPHLMKATGEESPVDLSRDYGMDVKALEKRIGYTFRNKYLLLEAMTHTSNMGGDRIRCYQVCNFQLFSRRESQVHSSIIFALGLLRSNFLFLAGIDLLFFLGNSFITALEHSVIN